MTDEVASICQKCGASVYKAHLDSGIARYEGGNLLCAHCVSEYERSHDMLTGADSNEFEAISLDDEFVVEKNDMSQSKIMTSVHTLGLAGGWDDSRYKRALISDQAIATRCRTFHSKMNEASLEFMNNQINEWIDGNEGMSIKFASTTIGPFEGKHTEPNLIVTIFY